MGKGFDFMFLWCRASVPNFNLVSGYGSPQPSERREGLFHAHGFHDNATLTLSPSLTTAVAATIAASTLSLGVSVTVVVLSIQAVMSMPA
jgi:hypothetical protein